MFNRSPRAVALLATLTLAALALANGGVSRIFQALNLYW